MPESQRAGGIQSRYFNDRGWATLDALRTVADELESEPIAVALAWQLAQPVITAPIIGANSVEQLGGSLAALDITLTEEQRGRLNGASAWDD